MGARVGIEIINPVANVSPGGDDEGQLKSVDKIEGIRVGLLDNNMPHAGDFLDHLGESFSEKYGATLFRQRKDMSARSAGKEILDEIASNCEVAVTGFGV